ncbi:MAG: phosphopyruvate hydratase, partial [Candidatus Micrarchaeia archaeon]
MIFMEKITRIKARKVIDSRGNPTVEVDIYSNKFLGRAIAPSGASKGSHEVKDYPEGGVDKGV